MKLYFHPLSPNSHRALLALNEKGIECELEQISFFGDPVAHAEFKKNVSKLGKVPVLKLPEDDWTIPESATIVEYLDTHFAGPSLTPADKDLARPARFIERVTDLYILEPSAFLFVDSHRPEDSRHPDLQEEAKSLINRNLDLNDGYMENKDFVVGDSQTFADITVTAALGAIEFQGFDIKSRKNLSAYLDKQRARPAFQKLYSEHIGPAVAAMKKNG